MAGQRIEVEYAPFWPRVGAMLIDTLLIAMIATPFLVLVYGPAYWLHEGLIAGPADFLISWVMPAIATLLFWHYRQATPGKIALSMRVVDADTGETLSGGQALGRYLAYFVAMAPLFLGVIWVAFDPRKRGWHDKLAGSVVVRASSRGAAPVHFRDAPRNREATEADARAPFSRERPDNTVVWVLLALVVALAWLLALREKPAIPVTPDWATQRTFAMPPAVAPPVASAPPVAPLPVPPAYHEPTAAERRDAQRRADEAMKIIEKTTPEM